ncbi:MAG: HD-GYP domain-containing protein [Bacillota bacterium]
MNYKRKIHIINAQPGQVLAEDVFQSEPEMSLIAPKNLRLSSHAIKRLLDFGVRYLHIYSEEKSPEIQGEGLIRLKEEFKSQYEGSANVVKEVLNDLVVGKKLEIETIEPVFSSMYEQVSQNYSLIDCINEVRTADAYTYHHSLNVSLYAGLLGVWLDLPQHTIQEIIQAGVLHDVGKAKISQEVLSKKGPLTAQEFTEMKKHSIFGYQLVKNTKQINDDICNGVLMHHEKASGEGYPLKLTNEKIHPYAKIIAVADVYDALTSERAYKKRFTPFDTFQELQKIGYTHFDPKIIITFLNNIVNYYIGAKVLMNTGETGEITAVLQQNITKPIVRIGDRLIDLSRDTNYQIVQMI